MSAESRSVHVTWEDPMSLARAAREMSGLEFLGKIVRGELPRPPIGELLDFGPVELAEGLTGVTGDASVERMRRYVAGLTQ